MTLRITIILLNLIWAVSVTAQNWDWVRTYNDYNGSMDVYNDNDGNIYSCFYTLNSVSLKHSNFGKNTVNSEGGSKIIKSNSRGKLLWGAHIYGKVLNIDVYDSMLYVITLVESDKQKSIEFGNSTIALQSNTQYSYCIVFKFRFDGQALSANVLFKQSKHLKSSNLSAFKFAIFDENKAFMILSVGLSKIQLGNEYLDSIVFKNTSIKIGANTQDFPFTSYLISISLDGDLNKKVGLNGVVHNEVHLNPIDKTIAFYNFDVSGIQNPLMDGDGYINKYSLNCDLISKTRIDRKYLKPNLNSNLHIGNDGNYYLITHELDSIQVGNTSIPLNSIKNTDEYTNSIIIKLDLNLRYQWHLKIKNDSSSWFGNTIAVNKDGEAYCIIHFEHKTTFDGHILRPYNNNNYSTSLLKISRTGKIVYPYYFPCENLSNSTYGAGVNFYAVWLDKQHNIIVKGNLSNSSKQVFVDIDSFFLSPLMNYLSFEARINTHKIEIVKKHLYCKGDSLKINSDSTFKWFKWVINGKTYFDNGKGIKPSLDSFGKFYVTIYAFEADSFKVRHIDSIFNYKPIDAEILLNKHKICRYSEIEFKDNSNIEPTLGSVLNSFLYFGDGSDTIFSNSYHENLGKRKYTDTGLFSITYIIEHEGCKDTQLLKNLVEVRNSPRSNFKIEAPKFCTPVPITLVNLYSGFYDSMIWRLNGKLLKMATVDTFQLTLTEPGIYTFDHSIYGYSCSNSSKSIISLKNGFRESDTLICKLVSVLENNSIELSWKPHPTSIRYLIQTGGKSWESLDSTIIINGLGPDKATIDFIIFGIDECGTKVSSNVIRTILLEGVAEQFNKFSDLRWSDYTKWYQGVKKYELLKLNRIDGKWELIQDFSPQDSTFMDFDFATDFSISNEKIYRIRAVENSTDYESFSNVLGLKYNPFVFIPNVFSPNGDGFNDKLTYRITGATNVLLSVYNRWGELVFFTKELNDYWDGFYNGSFCVQDVYVVNVTFRTNTGQLMNYSTTVQLLR